jgi:SAM-dependent methyltransferase
VTTDWSWEEEAEHWVRWVRTPGHDIYPQYRNAFFDEIVPPTGTITAEIGCGEGRVTRDLRERGHRVVSVDLSSILLGYAKVSDPGGAYIRADAAVLPLTSQSCSIVVAYNLLMNVRDLEGPVAEAARILQPGGCLCVSVAHPIGELVVTGSYFGRRPFDATEERDGLTMRFRGWSYDIEHYSRALERAGLAIEVLREPRPASGPPDYERWHRLPLFLQFRARKA